MERKKKVIDVVPQLYLLRGPDQLGGEKFLLRGPDQPKNKKCLWAEIYHNRIGPNWQEIEGFRSSVYIVPRDGVYTKCVR